jgi:Predicted 3'-5' exonuclease related to the exonuclease domain of PolB
MMSARLLGLSGKPEGIDGSQVEQLVLSGQIDEVSRYCESDVMNTYRVWLVYELFRGAITAGERQIRDFVQPEDVKSLSVHRSGYDRHLTRSVAVVHRRALAACCQRGR